MAEDARGGLLPAYLVVGADEMKRSVTLARLKRRLDADFADFNCEQLSGTQVDDETTLVSSLNMLPFGPGFRLVIVEQAEKLPKNVSEAIISYLSDPNPSTVLCLVAESLAKTTRLYKAVAKVGKTAIIDCAPKKRAELVGLVIKMAEARGMRMDRAAATELVARVGESTKHLDVQLAVLAEIMVGKGVVSRADVEAHVARTAEVKPWDFLDALSARDAARALELYGLMAAQGSSPVMLCALMAGRLRDLICARSLDQRGQAGSLASELGRPSFQVRSYPGWARRFAGGELEHALVSCARADRALKSGAQPDIELTSLILKVCGAA